VGDLHLTAGTRAFAVTSQSGVFVLQGDEALVPMKPAQFAAELDFQRLLSKYPSLLVGDQIDPDNPRRFVLVRQELSIGHEDDASRWSLDHLFLDQDGVPTLVEVKRQSDSRLRREVVGQMLDYAANFQSFWSAERIATAFEATCAQAGSDADTALAEFLGLATPAEQFWNSVSTNVRAGKLRLLFVADHIPTELRRVVEFLNVQMDPVEVLALELRQFAGEGLRTIVPVLFGQTREAAARKESVKGARWTEDRLIATFEERFPAAEAKAAKALLDWMKGSGLPLIYGTGRENGSVYPLLKPRGVAINPAYLSTEGKVWLQFKSLEGKPVFGDIDVRREMMSRFAKIDGVKFDEGTLTRWAAVPLAQVAADPAGVAKLIGAFDWIVEQVKAAG
jgi:phosphoglycolate phosphatase-like HAD superfamily hydrolase